MFSFKTQWKRREQASVTKRRVTPQRSGSQQKQKQTYTNKTTSAASMKSMVFTYLINEFLSISCQFKSTQQTSHEFHCCPTWYNTNVYILKYLNMSELICLQLSYLHHYHYNSRFAAYWLQLAVSQTAAFRFYVCLCTSHISTLDLYFPAHKVWTDHLWLNCAISFWALSMNSCPITTEISFQTHQSNALLEH